MQKRCRKLSPDLVPVFEPVILRHTNPVENMDREYQVGIFYSRERGCVEVITAWGRWGQSLQHKVVTTIIDAVGESFPGQVAAKIQLAANGAIIKKEEKGYGHTAAYSFPARFDRALIADALQLIRRAAGSIVYRIPEDELTKVAF